jgi:hypothetical protein
VSFLSRFDRQATESSDLPALLGTATEEFRRSLERHVQQIVEAAKQQAAEIERGADREARQREQQLDLRSQELVKGVVTRASSVLDSIELVQSAISGMLDELRAEVKALESGEAPPSPGARAKAAINPGLDQRQAKEPRAQVTQTPVAAPAAPKAEETAQSAQTKESRPAEGSQQPAKPADARPEQPAPAAEPEPPQPAAGPQAEPKQGALIERTPIEPTPQEDRNANSSAEFDQMIHGEIRRMFQSGKSREDVESFLARFELGDSYHGLLDELYSQKDPSVRRRIFGRRRDR